ncbi:MAG: hypothetical protein IM638_19900 [Bacteroidetes bacterium]|nr:hypothetical protein [Bacteroidota bacterium]
MESNFNQIANSYNDDFLSSMFILGIQLKFKNKEGKRIYINNYNNPVKDKFKYLWNEDEWHKARRGTINNIPKEEEYEKNQPLEGILFIKLQLRNIVESNLSDWTYFYVIGESLACLNNEEINLVEFQQVLMQVPSTKMTTFCTKFASLINDFKESDFVVKIGHQSDKSFVFVY